MYTQIHSSNIRSQGDPDATTASHGLAVSKGMKKTKMGESRGEGKESAREAPGRHPQFRDCFSDDTLYTHGQQQPTHYGNDTCASIRINILMDTREERRVAGWRRGRYTQTRGTSRGWRREGLEGEGGGRDGRCGRKKAT